MAALRANRCRLRRATADVRAQIEQAAARFGDTFNRGDAAGLAAMYDTAAVVQPPGQSEFTDRGKYVVLWKRQGDGTWKLYRDAFNTSMPPR